MSMLANILGFSLWGLAVRFGQLGIQRRPLFENMTGHAIAMGVFGYGGYWAWRWDQKSVQLIEQKKVEISERRKERVARMEAVAEKLGLEQATSEEH
ncbi:hypothetical protein K435DRAFT_772668 [Dendrothele bispora CBS 962.96]|uniref:Uncharacterized protein n=1 Tax=Dendrothele bispora (strain CBS 962.96) TaxID=1314807 RepID=A0A4S8MW29_DENBC|nr:hypothetical protein K435DRAFT_772668 [Dendrothele bispora CBS 962.96]